MLGVLLDFCMKEQKRWVYTNFIDRRTEEQKSIKNYISIQIDLMYIPILLCYAPLVLGPPTSFVGKVQKRRVSSTLFLFL